MRTSRVAALELPATNQNLGGGLVVDGEREDDRVAGGVGDGDRGREVVLGGVEVAVDLQDHPQIPGARGGERGDVVRVPGERVPLVAEVARSRARGGEAEQQGIAAPGAERLAEVGRRQRRPRRRAVARRQGRGREERAGKPTRGGGEHDRGTVVAVATPRRGAASQPEPRGSRVRSASASIRLASCDVVDVSGAHRTRHPRSRTPTRKLPIHGDAHWNRSTTRQRCCFATAVGFWVSRMAHLG